MTDEQVKKITDAIRSLALAIAISCGALGISLAFTIGCLSCTIAAQ